MKAQRALLSMTAVLVAATLSAATPGAQETKTLHETPGITAPHHSPLLPLYIMKYSLFIALASLLASGSSIAQAPPGKWAPLAVAPNDHVSVADQFSGTGVVECPIETVMEQLNSLGTKYAMGNGVGRNPKKGAVAVRIVCELLLPAGDDQSIDDVCARDWSKAQR
jgi:hypothetical protein